MMDHNAIRQKRTDPRPAYIFVGEDGEGTHHVYHTRTESVYEIRDGRVAHRRALDAGDINDYMAAVAGERSWVVRRLYEGLGDGIGDRVQPEEAI